MEYRKGYRAQECPCNTLPLEGAAAAASLFAEQLIMTDAESARAAAAAALIAQ